MDQEQEKKGSNDESVILSEQEIAEAFSELGDPVPEGVKWQELRCFQCRKLVVLYAGQTEEVQGITPPLINKIWICAWCRRCKIDVYKLIVT